MKTKEKQNKHKLKFDYIAKLQMLGKIWKEHCNLVNPNISKADNNYNNEVIKIMSKSKKEEYCSILERCDDIVKNINKIDGSLKKSHKKFSKYKKIILDG
tara:strand:- start:826 stop:1125 length:300 start_codon:yes stop_codon:yes gene_type:complete